MQEATLSLRNGKAVLDMMGRLGLRIESVSKTKIHDGGNHLLNVGSFHCRFNREKAFHGRSNTNRQQGHGIPLHINTEAPCTAMQRL